MAKRFPGKLRYRVPIYGVWVYFAFTDADASALCEWFKDTAFHDCAGFCKAYHAETSGDYRIVITTRHDADDPASWMVAAAHECLHAAFFICERVGIKVEAGNHEAFAYLQSDLFAEMMRQYAEWKDKHGTQREPRAAAPQ